MRRRGARTGISASIKAVFSVFTADQVGAIYNYLRHAGLSGNGTIVTKRAIIKQSTLISGGGGTTKVSIEVADSVNEAEKILSG